MLINPNLAQDNLALKYFSLSIHPRGEKTNASLMPNRLDDDKYLVLNLGAMVSYEHFVRQDIFSVKIVQALYADGATRLGGFSHIGMRGKIFKAGKHALRGGIGPTLVYRRNWLELEDYEIGNALKEMKMTGGNTSLDGGAAKSNICTGPMKG